MKSKARINVNPEPARDFKGMLLKLGDIWDDDFQAIMEEIIASRRTTPARLPLDFTDIVLAETPPKKRAKRRHRKR